jgi:hypothetical protein
MHIVGDGDVIGHAHYASQGTAAADNGTAGDANAARDRGMRTDLYVVSDVHLIVDHHPIADYGIADSAAIYGRTSPDLHVIAKSESTQLRNPYPAALFVAIAETVTA